MQNSGLQKAIFAKMSCLMARPTLEEHSWVQGWSIGCCTLLQLYHHRLWLASDSRGSDHTGEDS